MHVCGSEPVCVVFNNNIYSLYDKPLYHIIEILKTEFSDKMTISDQEHYTYLPIAAVKKRIQVITANSDTIIHHYT